MSISPDFHVSLFKVFSNVV